MSWRLAAIAAIGGGIALRSAGHLDQPKSTLISRKAIRFRATHQATLIEKCDAG